jgi:hypothetical protein
MQGCRYCETELKHQVIDLGTSPFANSFLKKDQLSNNEARYPLNLYVCHNCFLVQLGFCADPHDFFDHYSYFSSYSSSWVAHAKQYVELMIERFSMDQSWQVVEVASNDGYLLQSFMEKGIPVIGVEPAENVAAIAQKKGVPTRVDYFNQQTARQMIKEGLRADVLIGNNVFAHVPTINDFVAAIQSVLSYRGVVTLEFPHLKRMIENNEFDTIYHEHFFYHSLMTTKRIFEAHGLEIFDVEELSTHGGSLRVFAKQSTNRLYTVSKNVARVLHEEEEMGLNRLETYQGFASRVQVVKHQLIDFLHLSKKTGKRVVGYGAPAKGNTLLNYCGLDSSFIEYTVDKSPHKQGCYLPGTHIPILSPDKIFETQPDYLLILPWNIQGEIVKEMQGIRAWGGQFVVPIPDVHVLT